MPDRKQTPDVLAEILGEVGEIELAHPTESSVVTDARHASPAPRRNPDQEAEPVARRARWEYRVVSFQNYRGWRPRYVNGEEITDWTVGPLLHDYLNELGGEGWQLAGASAGQPMYGSADYHQLYFKR